MLLRFGVPGEGVREGCLAEGALVSQLEGLQLLLSNWPHDPGRTALVFRASVSPSLKWVHSDLGVR